MTGTPQIIIRLTQLGDIVELAAVLKPEVSLTQVDQRWQEHQSGYREMLIAELDGQVVGTVSIGGHGHQLPDSLRMFPLDVGTKFRRRGVGTALVEAVEEIARRQELQTINLEVGVENDGALRMYEQLGYLRLGNPEIVRWCSLSDNGKGEQIEELSWVMTKGL